jgi:hypothetical protein
VTRRWKRLEHHFENVEQRVTRLEDLAFGAAY